MGEAKKRIKAMLSAIRSRAPRAARLVRRYGSEEFKNHPGDGLGGAQPSAQKEIACATAVGVVGGIWWLNAMGENRTNVTAFWKLQAQRRVIVSHLGKSKVAQRVQSRLRSCAASGVCRPLFGMGLLCLLFVLGRGHGCG